MRYYFGTGLVNDAINKLPFELHIPGYNYCGPGTKLQQRLLKGDRPINGLDAGCMKHDIAYHNSKDLASRHAADRELADIAMQRFRARNASIGEKMAALGVAGAMKAKVKLGMGLGNNSCPKVIKSCLKSLGKIKAETDYALRNIETYTSGSLLRRARRKEKSYKLPKKIKERTNNELEERLNVEKSPQRPHLGAIRKRRKISSMDRMEDDDSFLDNPPNIEEPARMKRKLSLTDDDGDDMQPPLKYLKTES